MGRPPRLDSARVDSASRKIDARVSGGQARSLHLSAAALSDGEPCVLPDCGSGSQPENRIREGIGWRHQLGGEEGIEQGAVFPTGGRCKRVWRSAVDIA